MKKVKYRNNNYNSQVYSLNYKFDSISPAGKFCGTALDLIKRYNELAKEAQANGNIVEAEVFRQYAEHYRKIITEINERKNIRFNTKDVQQNNEASETMTSDDAVENKTTQDSGEDNNAENESVENKPENTLVETKVKTPKKSFKVIEVSEKTQKVKKATKPRAKKDENNAVND